MLERDWVLPCGEPERSDLFVVAATGGDGSAAADAAPLLSAAEIDAIRASQVRRGENSYYYSVNKNLGNTVAPTEPHVPKAVHVARPVVRGSTISTYAMIDGDAKVKVNIPLAGTKRLPANGIAIGFFDRSFKLAIRPDAGTELSLNIPLLLETIDQHACAVKVLDGRIVLHMTKREAGKVHACVPRRGGLRTRVAPACSVVSTRARIRPPLVRRCGTSCARLRAWATRSLTLSCRTLASSSSSSQAATEKRCQRAWRPAACQSFLADDFRMVAAGEGDV